MNVLQVHNYYKNSGGEDIVLEAERKLIQNNGGKVFQYIKDNKNINGLYDALKVALNINFSKKVYNEFGVLLDQNRPDIVHVHNFFPLITPAIFDCTLEKNIPSVLTLHNYRLLHPNGLMLHNGKIDERGITKSAYHCIPDRVYRNSVFQTAVVAYMIEYHKKNKTWENKVDYFIALTDFAKQKFVEGGLPEEKIVVKPNFIEDPLEFFPILDSKSLGEDYIFVGRVSEEKGIQFLVETWMKNGLSQKLLIVGDGPLKKELQNQSSGYSNIKWLGRKENKDVLNLVANAKALIFPSICYEGFPVTILEALSVGCPVICSNIGSQQSIIKDGHTGLHFKVSDSRDLVGKVKMLEQNNNLANSLSKNARKTYEENYTPQKNYELLMDIYNKFLSGDA